MKVDDEVMSIDIFDDRYGDIGVIFLHQPGDGSFQEEFCVRFEQPRQTRWYVPAKLEVTKESSPAGKKVIVPCSGCNGTGRYVGFTAIEDPCQKCFGSRVETKITHIYDSDEIPF